MRGHLRIQILGARPEDRLRRESEHRAQRRGRTRPVCDQLLHGHAVEREPARRPCPLRAQRSHGSGARGSGLRHRSARRLHGAQVRGVGPPHHEGPGNREVPARRQMADHDPRRELQADRRRGRAQGRHRSLQPDHGDPPADGQDAAQPGRRGRRLQRPQREFLRVPRQGGHRSCRRRIAHLQAPRGRRRHGTDLVRPVEQRLRLRAADPGRRQDDADGEPDRPHPIQGRLWSGRRLLPASQDLHSKRLWAGLRGLLARFDQGDGRGLRRSAPGADLPAQPRPSRGGQGRQGPDPHGDEGGLQGSAQGDSRLGELPRHDDRAGGRLGVAEHRSQGNQSRADHVRALRHGLARDVFRRLGKRSGGLRTRRNTSGATIG